jgi:hypothetical protein
LLPAKQVPPEAADIGLHLRPAHRAGNNTYGSLGTDPTGRLPLAGEPVPVYGNKTYSMLSASQWGRFICGLLVDQSVECWGEPAGPASAAAA